MLSFERIADRVPGGLLGKLPTADPRVLVRSVLRDERGLHSVGGARGSESRAELAALHIVPIKRRGDAGELGQAEVQQRRIPPQVFPSFPFLRVRRIRKYQPVEAQDVGNELGDVDMILDRERCPAVLRHDPPPFGLAYRASFTGFRLALFPPFALASAARRAASSPSAAQRMSSSASSCAFAGRRQ